MSYDVSNCKSLGWAKDLSEWQDVGIDNQQTSESVKQF